MADLAFITTNSILDRFTSERVRAILNVPEDAYPSINLPLHPVLVKCVANANAIVMGYVRKQCQQPIRRVPPLLVSIAEKVCMYELLCTDSEKVRETDLRLYEETMKQLSSLKRGDIDIEPESNQEANDSFAPVGSVSVGSESTEARTNRYSPMNLGW